MRGYPSVSMNILFLNPPFKGRFSRTSRSPAVAKGGTLYYPIWLAYAAGGAEAAGRRVTLVDAPARGYSPEQVECIVRDFAPDLVVVDTSTASIYNDVAMAGRLKEMRPDGTVVLVGTHPSALPQETLALADGVDAVAVGEYDETVRELAAALEAGRDLSSVAGLVLRQGQFFVETGPRRRIEDLDRLPFVSAVYKKHLRVRDYFFAAANDPMVMIMTGRGCPYRCFFCVYPQVMHGRRYRTRSAENVVEELSFIERELPEVREVGFEDDCFTASRSRVHAICELILKRGLRTVWYCNARGNLDYATLALMKRAGCRLITVGFESGSQPVLDAMHKGEKVETYLRFARDARRAGILVHGCIMTGNPGDNRETLRQSYELARRMNCDSMQFYPLYVYPGTEAYEWARKNGYLRTEDFSRWVDAEGLHNCVLDTPELSAEEMVGLCDHYLKKYHLRPGYIAAKLWQGIRQPREGVRTMKSARIFLGKIMAGQLGGKNGRR